MPTLPAILRMLCAATGWWIISGTALSLTRWQHWYPRMWDFPRQQAVTLLGLSSLVYAAATPRKGPRDWGMLALMGGTALFHASKILPYTPFWPRQVKTTARRHADRRRSLRMVTSNVKMENQRMDLWLRVVTREQPDVILAVETNHRWAHSLNEALRETYPHAILVPQENWYGMSFFSRLPIVRYEVLRLIQEDIPSLHVVLKLEDGSQVKLIGLHPRPPEPLRDQDAKPRDAELVTVGRDLGDKHDRGERMPTVVAGDLNDVAWSRTTALFLRLSGLLDPRVGRGTLNTFDADKYFLRFPLDHVFHTNDFTLTDLRRLKYVGSDHFAVLIDLALAPEEKHDQPELEERAGDQQEADEKQDAARDA